MGTTGVSKPTAASVFEGDEPSSGQFYKKRARTPTPPLKTKVLVFDCELKTVSVQQEKDVIACKLFPQLGYRANSDGGMQTLGTSRRSLFLCIRTRSQSSSTRKQSQ